MIGGNGGRVKVREARQGRVAPIAPEARIRNFPRAKADGAPWGTQHLRGDGFGPTPRHGRPRLPDASPWWWRGHGRPRLGDVGCGGWLRVGGPVVAGGAPGASRRPDARSPAPGRRRLRVGGGVTRPVAALVPPLHVLRVHAVLRVTSVAAIYEGVFGCSAPYGYTSLPVLIGTAGGEVSERDED